MLSVTRYSAGKLSDVKELSLVLPIDKFGGTIIVSPEEGSINAVFLGGDHSYSSFQLQGEANWGGIIVGDIGFEADFSSTFDCRRFGHQRGALVRADDGLFISSTYDSFYERLVPLMRGLTQCGSDYKVGFRKWQVVVGSGLEKSVLFSVDISSSASS